MSQMNFEERRQIYKQAIAAMSANDWDAGVKLIQTVPYPPELARLAKQVYGADFMKQSGFNLSEAERMYGSNWLDN